MCAESTGRRLQRKGLQNANENRQILRFCRLPVRLLCKSPHLPLPLQLTPLTHTDDSMTALLFSLCH